MAAVNLNRSEWLDETHYVIDDSPDVFTNIYDEQINLAIYDREVSAQVIQYVQNLLQKKQAYSFKQIIKPDEVKQTLKQSLPGNDFINEFVEDLNMLCDMYAVLFGLKQIGLRLSVLEHAMCPRFHVDNIPCRLLTTYGGTGTEWLSEDNTNRSKLGRGNNGLSDSESGVYLDENGIKQLAPYAVALLKGESWPDNHGRGVVHRSPAINSTNPRLLLSLDFV